MSKLCYLLLLSLSCLCRAETSCPRACFCAKFRIITSVVMHMYCGNSLTTIPRDFIDKDITTLDLTSNRIGVLKNPDKTVTNQTQLRTLVIAKNNLTLVSENALQGFPSLETLDLSQNNITKLPNEVFQTTKNLTKLVLSYNPALVLPEDGFQIAQLEVLLIDHCNVTTIPLQFFTTMPNLKQVHMEFNFIQQLDPCQYKTFRKMQFVNLESNRLTVFPNEVSKLMSEYLVVISLNGNPFACDCPFKQAIGIYTESHIEADTPFWYTESKHELFCLMPGTGNNTLIGSDGQLEFFSTLDCNATLATDVVFPKCNATDEDDLDFKDVQTNVTDSFNVTDGMDVNVSNETLDIDVGFNVTHLNVSEESIGNVSTNVPTQLVDDSSPVLSGTKRIVWISLGVVGIVVLFLIVVFAAVKKLGGLSRSSRTNAHQFGLLSELHDDDNDYN